jgi:hypothetical protein
MDGQREVTREGTQKNVRRQSKCVESMKGSYIEEVGRQRSRLQQKYIGDF